MHLPDGSLDNVTCTLTTMLAAGAVSYAYRRARREAAGPNAGEFAATSAYLFAVQMVNFPVAAGVSGHMIGAALAGAILGPWRGLLAVALVLAAQCLLAGDGGLTTLGANVLSMGVVATWGGVALRKLLASRAQSSWSQLAGAAFAAWASVVAAGVVCAVIWAVGGGVPVARVLAPMAEVHARIGLGEALFTLAALTAMQLFRENASTSVRRVSAVISIAAAIAVAALLAPWASGSPDGLEHVAAAWANWPVSAPFFAPLPDYLVPGVSNEALATGLAGMLGVAIVVMVARATEHALAPVRRVR